MLGWDQNFKHIHTQTDTQAQADTDRRTQKERERERHTHTHTLNNIRGNILEEFLVEKQLHILNEESELTTFESTRGSSNISNLHK